MNKVLVATNNKGKQREIRALLGDLPVKIETPDLLKSVFEVKEDGQSYKENAQKKVLAYASVLYDKAGWSVLADDSGLEVDVLNGEPGVQSARFSKIQGATDAERRRYLLDQLSHHPRPWTACFRCVVVLYDPKTGLHFSEGVCQGEVIPEERGDHGFGYDPIFLVAGRNQTMAELSMDEKNKLSHRARAIKGIKPVLSAILNR
jgi:XTP/dITP diphosphohydrolase